MTALFFLAALVLAGFVMVAYGVYGFFHFYKEEWVAGKGCVIRCGGEWASGSQYGVSVYRPCIRYSYDFGGQQRFSERMYPTRNQLLASQADIQKFMAIFKESASIDICINRRRGDAVVFLANTEKSKSHFAAVAISGVLVAAASAALAFLI